MAKKFVPGQTIVTYDLADQQGVVERRSGMVVAESGETVVVAPLYGRGPDVEARKDGKDAYRVSTSAA